MKFRTFINLPTRARITNTYSSYEHILVIRTHTRHTLSPLLAMLPPRSYTCKYSYPNCKVECQRSRSNRETTYTSSTVLNSNFEARVLPSAGWAFPSTRGPAEGEVSLDPDLPGTNCFRTSKSWLNWSEDMAVARGGSVGLLGGVAGWPDLEEVTWEALPCFEPLDGVGIVALRGFNSEVGPGA